MCIARVHISIYVRVGILRNDVSFFSFNRGAKIALPSILDSIAKKTITFINFVLVNISILNGVYVRQIGTNLLVNISGSFVYGVRT